MIWKHIEYLVSVVGALGYLIFFSRCMTVNPKISPKIYLSAQISYILLISLANYLDMQTRYLTLIVSLVFCFLLFRSHWLTIISWCITALVITGVSDLVVTSASVYFPGVTFASTDEPGLSRVLCSAGVKVLQIICYLLITIRIQKDGNMDKIDRILFIGIPVSAWVILEVFFTYIGQLSDAFEKSRLPILGGVAMLTILISAIILHNNAIIHEQELASTQLKLKTANLTRSHVEQLRQLYDNLAEVRHNYSHHLLVILAMCKNGNYDHICEYIQKLGDLDVSQNIITGNIIIDSLVSSKIAPFASIGARFDVDIKLPQKMPISEVEQSILFGNILENAFESILQNASSNNKFVKLKACETERYWVVVCQNTSSDGMFHSTQKIPSSKPKQEYHGIGTKQITEIADKANGFASFQQANSVFTATIMMRVR